MNFKIIMLGIFAVVFWSCGGSAKNITNSTVSSMPDFAILKDDGLTLGTTSVSGSGSFTFIEPPSGDAINLTVNFSLVDEDSSIEFYAFSDSNLSKSKAVIIKIQKIAGALKGFLSIAGSEAVDVNFENLSDSITSLQIDIHNDEEPSHILIWSGSETTFNEEMAIFNSEDSPELSILGQKTGTALFVGVKLVNASLSSLEIHDPKFED